MQGELLEPGLQPERTDLAWQRTALAFLVNAGLVARIAAHVRWEWAAFAIAGTLALSGMVALAYARRLYVTRSAGLALGSSAVSARPLRALWLATTLIGRLS